MKNAFIIHGIYGDPGENWFPWLKKELESEGIETYVPHLQTTDPLLFDDWMAQFEPFQKQLSADSILIGHSLGCAFALSLLEEHPIHSVYLVAPAWGKTDNEFHPIMKDVSDRDFQFDRIKEHCSQFHIYHSPTDPYLKMERAETLRDHLDAALTVIPDAGHINESAGFLSFPELLNDIQLHLFV